VRFRGVSDARSVHVTIVISRIVLRGVRAQAGRQARPSWRERDTGAARAINPRDRSGPGPTEPAITQTVHDLVGAASKLSHDRQTDTGRQSECDGDRTFAPSRTPAPSNPPSRAYASERTMVHWVVGQTGQRIYMGHIGQYL